MKLLRDAAAHGGNLFETLKTTPIWEISAALEGWIGERQVFTAMWENRNKYELGTFGQMGVDYEAVGNAFQALDGAIDWAAAGLTSAV